MKFVDRATGQELYIILGHVKLALCKSIKYA